MDVEIHEPLACAEELEQLRNETRQLKEEIGSLKLREENCTLREENLQLKFQLQTVQLKDQVQRLTSENQQLREENERLRTEISTQKAENDKLRAENSHLHNENHGLGQLVAVEELEHLRNETRQLKEEINSLKLKEENSYVHAPPGLVQTPAGQRARFTGGRPHRSSLQPVLQTSAASNSRQLLPQSSSDDSGYRDGDLIIFPSRDCSDAAANCEEGDPRELPDPRNKLMDPNMDTDASALSGTLDVPCVTDPIGYDRADVKPEPEWEEVPAEGQGQRQSHPVTMGTKGGRAMRSSTRDEKSDMEIAMATFAETTVSQNQTSKGRSRAEVQRLYRERQKTLWGKTYLEKERERLRKYYVPAAELSDEEKRRRSTIRREARKMRLERLKVEGIPVTQVRRANTASKQQQQQKPSAKPRAHVCDQCGKKLSNACSYRKHKRTVHSMEPEVMCPVTGCGRVFQRTELLEDHTRNMHSTERPYLCDVCGKTFALKHYRNEHASHCGRKRYKCAVCSKDFASRSTFRDHKRSHEGYQNVCPCGKVLKWSSAASKHRKMCPLLT